MRLWLFVMGLWAVAPLAFAGSLTAQLDRTIGDIGEPFYLTVLIEGSHDGDLDFPAVENLRIRRGAVSQSHSIVNGRASSEVRVSYEIVAQKAGKYEVPSLSAEIDGKTEKTLPIKFEVKAGGGGLARQKQQQEKYDVEILRECETDQPYVGQQVMCTTKLLYPATVTPRAGATEASGDFRRFGVARPKQYQTYYQGKRYAVVEWSELIVAVQDGEHVLLPFTVEASVRNKRRGRALDDIFGGGGIMFSMPGYREVEMKGEPTVFKVRPMPPGAPQGFEGLVGDFRLDASLSTGEVKQGDTVTVTIRLSGRGISDHVPQPELGVDDIGKVYADKPRYEEGVTPQEGLTSVREFKLAFVPAKTGTFDLPIIEIPYFDPEAGTYKVLGHDLGRLTVLPGEGMDRPDVFGGTPEVAAAGRKEVEQLGQDLIGLHRNADLVSTHVVTTGYLITCVTASSLPLFGAFAFAGWLSYGGGNERRRRRALVKRAGVDLVSALRGLSLDDPTRTVETGYTALKKFFADRYGAEAGALTPGDIRRILGEQGCAEIGEALAGFGEAAAHIAYGGKTFEESEARAWLDGVCAEINKLG